MYQNKQDSFYRTVVIKKFFKSFRIGTKKVIKMEIYCSAHQPKEGRAFEQIKTIKLTLA